VAAYGVEGRVVERQGFFVYGVQAEAVSPPPEANFSEGMIDWQRRIARSVVSGADNHRCTTAGQKARCSN
jgi:hypothetical protein